jgi:hypothetical protein
MSLDQINSFLHELEYFVAMTDVEQIHRLSDKLPTIEEYQQRRMGSSAVGVWIALTEYVNSLSYMILR